MAVLFVLAVWLEDWRWRFVLTLAGLWVLYFGGCVGSFLNVVVYRAPRGQSVVRPKSRCPQCGHGIRWRHNIPVLGWLLLRGRCRDCQWPIPARYPLVEAAVAVMFLALAAALYVSEGASLPLRTPNINPARGQYGEAYLACVFVYFATMLCVLLACALIEYDRQRVPPGLVGLALMIGLLAPIAWPEIRPAAAGISGIPPSSWFSGLLDGAIGFAVGGALAASASAGRGGIFTNNHRWAMACEFAVAGVFLGWQTAAVVLAVAALLWGVARLIRPAPVIAASGWTLLVAFAWFLFWRPLHTQLQPLFSPAAATLAAAAGVTFTAGWITRRLSPAAPDLPIQPPISGGEPTTMEDQDQIDANVSKILASPSYILAEEDTRFLKQPELRPVRVQLELLKPEMAFAEHNIRSTIVVFGGTQVIEQDEAERRLALAKSNLDSSPDDPRRQRIVARAERLLAKAKYYDAAREFTRLVSSQGQAGPPRDYVIITGGGPGIMEAANRGAYDVQAESIGLNITLPAEQAPNPYITPELCFQFHYFALRKMHFLLRAKALVVFPGGFGTLDELFDALTLRQTQRMQEIPIILFGKEYWDRVLDFQFLADEGVIADEHLDLIDYADTPEEAWGVIDRFHHHSVDKSAAGLS